MNMQQGKSLNDVFSLLRQGDREGLEILYNTHYNKMYGIAFSVVKNETMAEDVVHNVVFKFMTMARESFPLSNQLTWLFSVVKNEALMLLRKEKGVISIEQIGEIGLEDKNIKEYVDLDAFNSMIKSLNDKQKTVVSLKILGGYTHKEIAAMLNKPLGTILWLYNTSIKKLKIILTSILSSVFVLFGVFIDRVCRILTVGGTSGDIGDSSPGIGDSFPGTGDVAEQLFNSELCYIAIIGTVLLILLVFFIIIYRKSEKIPIKAATKSI